MKKVLIGLLMIPTMANADFNWGEFIRNYGAPCLIGIIITDNFSEDDSTRAVTRPLACGLTIGASHMTPQGEFMGVSGSYGSRRSLEEELRREEETPALIRYPIK